MNAYTLSYLYPFKDLNKAKIFKNSNSFIIGANFKRNKNIINDLKKTEQFSFFSNYSIYFLIDSSAEDVKIYVGQTTIGIDRILQHEQKSFWSECYIFTTTDNSWNKTMIDYLEHNFISRLLKSRYNLENSDERIKEPNLTMFEKPGALNNIEEIIRILECNGIVIAEEEYDEKEEYIYTASRNKKAKIAFKDGEFILLKGSEVTFPKSNTKEWSDNGKFYNRYTELLNEYKKNKFIKEENGRWVLKKNLSFKSPSKPASLTTGLSENGWKFWEGLDKVRGAEG